MSTGPSSERPMSESGDVIGLDTLLRLPGRVVLPPVGTESVRSQRHEVNPAIALNLISEIQAVVIQWRDQLREVVRSLHVIQSQGPMVDGWLESSCMETSAPTAAAAILRHGDADALMQYVESLETGSGTDVTLAAAAKIATQSAIPTPVQNSQLTTADELTASGATEYRLCRLDENGQMQSQHCPAEQMGLVSVAIARYQNYKQLLIQKQAIEAKLQAAVDQLSGIRNTLQ